MPTVTVELEEGDKEFEVEEGKRLVLALEDNGVDVSHRCGGFANCTTCRCDIKEGEPNDMTKAERNILNQNDHFGDFRLSCQIQVEDDLTLTPLNRVSDMEWEEPGPRPEDEITPPAEWILSPQML